MKEDDIYHDINNIKNKDVDYHGHENLYRKMLRINNNHFHHHRIRLEHQLQQISRKNLSNILVS